MTSGWRGLPFFSKLKTLRATPDLSGKQLLFIAGLHRSGTSILHRQLGEHPLVSAFHGTGVPEDEGQHLQDVFPPARAFGGPGRFAFDPRAHLTEQDAAAVSPADRDRLLRQWGAHWDLSRPVLVEKSPPTLVRARFFQALFPDSRFAFLVRHPIPVALATQKWAKTPISELVAHWQVAHARMLDDLRHLRHARVVRYEDYVRDPDEVLTGVHGMVGLEGSAAHEPTSDRNPAYFERWDPGSVEAKIIHESFGGSGSPAEQLGYSLEPPYIQEWTVAN